MKKAVALLSIIIIISMGFTMLAQGSDDGSITMPRVTIPSTTQHVHSWSAWTQTVAPTCTVPGAKTRTCSGCGKMQSGVVRSLGHDYETFVVSPTETEGGYTLHRCTREGCGYSYRSDEAEALGHDYQTTVVAPTCTAWGYTRKVCSRCGDSDITDEKEPLGHNWGDWLVTLEPTASAEGAMTRTCARCGETETLPIDPLLPSTDSGWETPGQSFTTTTTTKAKINIAKCSVSNIQAKTYTGKAHGQSPVVKYGKVTLKYGRDYTLSYKNNVNIGVAGVIITGKGNYKGQLTRGFQIRPKNTASFKAVAKKSKKMKLTWKKQTVQTHGYQIQYSTSPKFDNPNTTKLITVKGAKKASCTVKGLKKKQYYYVRIRTYKQVGKQRIVSFWSATKRIKAK